MTDRAAGALQRTPLHDLHLRMGGKMVPFAGYEMPVQYPPGVKKEHLHTREKAGLFDVSHMGQLTLRGDRVSAALEALVPVDVIDLPEGKQRYALFTNAEGGILDDLMVTNYGDCLYLVVNAACKDQDVAHLKANLGDEVTIEVLDDRALVALQGPASAAVMARLAPDTVDMVFMDSRRMSFLGADCFISRSGYTGEDGFEISIPAAQAEAVVREMIAQEEVEPIGLGARDSLRLEAGLCLYGHDLDATTTPAEASLIWAVSKARRSDGVRPGGFIGADVVLEQIATKQVSRKRVGLVGEGRAPVREGTKLFDGEGNPVGTVTSGTFGPSAGVPIAMAFVAAACAALDTELFAEVRGKLLPMRVTKMPFIPQRYFRG